MADDATSGAVSPTHRDGPAKKSKWDLAEKFALPVALVLLPIIFQFMAAWQAERTNAAKTKQDREEQTRKEARDREDQKFQLYTNLLIKREEADAAVRRGLFEKLLGTYLEANPRDPHKKLIELELLALNFNDALNLSPLFWELQRLIEEMPQGAAREKLQDQLNRVGSYVKASQAAVLEIDGFRQGMDIPLDYVGKGGPGWAMSVRTLKVGDAGGQDRQSFREFTVSVLEHDPANRRLFVSLDSPGIEKPFGFWVDPFDFPLVNFTRISSTERAAVILQTYDEPKGIAKLVLLYFPSSRSAARDKPYVDELLKTLLPQPGGVTSSDGQATAGSSSLGK